MQTHRLFSTAATILGLTCTAAHADLYMELGINKRYTQTTGQTVKFDSGELNLYLRDGNIILAPCTSDPQLYFYPPHLFCPLGITGFVAWGDFNRDGVNDANQYWSIDGVVGAQVIAPSYPQLCALISGPPSKLPRPLKVFRDGTVTVFHDLRSPQVIQYNIAVYEMIRRYGSVRQVETIVTTGAVTVPGNLAITVSGVDFPVPVTVQVPVDVEIDPMTQLPTPVYAETWAETMRVAMEANPEISAVYTVGGTENSIVLTEITPNGNDASLNMQINLGTPPAGGTVAAVVPINSLNTTSGVLVSSPAGALKQMNEELVNGRYIFSFPSKVSPTTIPVNMAVTIVPSLDAYNANPRMKGTGFRFTSGAFSEGYYEMDPRVLNNITWTGNDATNIVPGDQIFFSILNQSESRIEFPPTVPQTPVILATPAVQAYTLPPGFFDVGDQNILDLRFQRSLGFTGASFDRSKREFRMDVKFVDSYLGWAQSAFPLGTSGDTSPAADFDRDGMTNIEEYAYQFPTQAEIIAGAKPQLPGNYRFMRLLETEPETVADVATKPDGVIGPMLDDDNHVVLKVPYRAYTGTSLKYEFVEVTKTENNKGKVKVKTKKIKPGTNWLVTYETADRDGDGQVEDATRLVRAQVERIDATGAVIEVTTYPDPDVFPPQSPITVNMTQQFIVLRSKNPVKNPAAPLPDIQVKLTAVDIR